MKLLGWNTRIPPQQQTYNLNENTIPPKQIREGDEFRAVLSSHQLAPFTYRMTTEDKINSILQNYAEESPWLSEVIEKDEVVL